MINDGFLHLLKDSLAISTIIERRVVLKNNGNKKIGLCPFHKEKTPSFIVNDNKGFYHCFGCGVHGDIIDFIARFDGLSFQDSVKYIADYAGISMPNNIRKNKKVYDEWTAIGQVNEFAMKWFYNNLLSCNAVLTYLVERNVSTKFIKDFSLGYAPSHSNELVKELLKNFSAKIVIASGLVNKNMHCRFWNRIIFPIINNVGICIGFGGRIFNEKDIKVAKYINTAEGPLFKKSNILYGINLAKDIIKSTRIAYLVEGYFDVISMKANGFSNVVGCMGTSLSAESLQSLWAISDSVVMIMDGDRAGYNAVQRIVLDIVLPNLRIGKTVKIVILSNGKDPDTIFMQNNGKLIMKEAINNSLFLEDFIYKILYKKFIHANSCFDDYAKLRNAFKKYSNKVVNRDLGYELLRVLKEKLYYNKRYNKNENKLLAIDGHIVLIQALYVLIVKYPAILNNKDLEEQLSYVLSKIVCRNFIFCVETNDIKESVHNLLDTALMNISSSNKFNFITAEKVFSWDVSYQDAYINYFLLIVLLYWKMEGEMELDDCTNEMTVDNIDMNWQRQKILIADLSKYDDEILKICFHLGIGVS